MTQDMLQRAAGDPFLQDFFSRIPRPLAASFTAEQLMAVRMAFGARHRGSHAVDLRLSLPLPRNRWYLVLLAGTERRSPSRRQLDRQRYPLRRLGNFVVAVLFAGMLAAAGIGLLYMLKSALGINLFDDLSLGLWPDTQQQLRHLRQ